MKSALTTIDEDPKLNFWRLIHGGFLDLAVLEWCKVFGSNAEPTHWKGVVEDRVAFTEALLNSVGLNRDEWDSYWNHLKSYRDDFAAHLVEAPRVGIFPDLDVALRSSYFYYDYLSHLLGDETLEKLESYCERFLAQAIEIGSAANAATQHMKEKIY